MPDPSKFMEWGLAGALVFVIVSACWYLLTKRMPKMQDDFNAQLTAERAQAAADTKAEREQAQAQHKEVMARIDMRHEAVMARIDRRHEEQMEAHADARHATRDLAHAAGLKQLHDQIEKEREDKKRKRPAGDNPNG